MGVCTWEASAGRSGCIREECKRTYETMRWYKSNSFHRHSFGWRFHLPQIGCRWGHPRAPPEVPPPDRLPEVLRLLERSYSPRAELRSRRGLQHRQQDVRCSRERCRMVIDFYMIILLYSLRNFYICNKLQYRLVQGSPIGRRREGSRRPRRLQEQELNIFNLSVQLLFPPET